MGYVYKNIDGVDVGFDIESLSVVLKDVFIDTEAEAKCIGAKLTKEQIALFNKLISEKGIDYKTYHELTKLNLMHLVDETTIGRFKDGFYDVEIRDDGRWVLRRGQIVIKSPVGDTYDAKVREYNQKFLLVLRRNYFLNWCKQVGLLVLGLIVQVVRENALFHPWHGLLPAEA